MAVVAVCLAMWSFLNLSSRPGITASQLTLLSQTRCSTEGMLSWPRICGQSEEQALGGCQEALPFILRFPLLLGPQTLIVLGSCCGKRGGGCREAQPPGSSLGTTFACFLPIPANFGAFLVAQMVKNLPAIWKTQVQSVGPEDSLEKGMATHSIIIAWRIPWTEEPGGLESMGLQSQTRLSD